MSFWVFVYLFSIFAAVELANKSKDYRLAAVTAVLYVGFVVTILTDALFGNPTLDNPVVGAFNILCFFALHFRSSSERRRGVPNPTWLRFFLVGEIILMLVAYPSHNRLVEYYTIQIVYSAQIAFVMLLSARKAWPGRWPLRLISG